jgi:hypothetical protein
MYIVHIPGPFRQGWYSYRFDSYKAACEFADANDGYVETR